MYKKVGFISYCIVYGVYEMNMVKFLQEEKNFYFYNQNYSLNL